MWFWTPQADVYGQTNIITCQTFVSNHGGHRSTFLFQVHIWTVTTKKNKIKKLFEFESYYLQSAQPITAYEQMWRHKCYNVKTRCKCLGSVSFNIAHDGFVKGLHCLFISDLVWQSVPISNCSYEETLFISVCSSTDFNKFLGLVLPGTLSLLRYYIRWKL